MLLGFIPVAQANTAEAVLEAEKERGADNLVGVTVDNRSYYLLLVNLQRVRVQGLAVKSK